MTPILEARDVELARRLNRTSLEVGPSQMIAIIGPNGSGKTSLLRALAGIEATSGTVRVCGESLDEASPFGRMRLLSFLPASRNVIWPISVRDVIALGLSSPDPGRIELLIEQLELQALADRPVSRLSTGERARALIARALAACPSLLLLDEPLSNLDPYWVLKTLKILRSETAAHASSALVSVHDLDQVAEFDRVILIDRGSVAADGSPEEILNSPKLSKAFRIDRVQAGWRIREDA
ncbi:ABC transporter ATP-binding protein [Sphingomonas daechungensis]|uniref:ABC transporter ATP-binding protein n=1 Tax=Sphingomonas daechungensis TaxID=1176646 RepID=UPI003782EB55